MADRIYSSLRRTAAAATTRADILRAALDLFQRRGYALTGMSEIASTAGVALNTVYSSVGNKPRLLIALLEAAVTDEAIPRAMDVVLASRDSSQALQALGHGTRLVFERHEWLLGALYDNAAGDPVIGAVLQQETEAFDTRLRRAAVHLRSLGDTAEALTAVDITTLLWFYFGFSPWRTLRDARWGWARAERWLVDQATTGILAAR